MLGKRIITAVVGIAIAIYVIDYGQWLFSAAVSVLALLAWREYYSMLKNNKIACLYWPGTVAVLLLQLSAWLGNTHEIIMIVYFFIFTVLVKVIIDYPKFSIADAAFTTLGFIYVGLSFSYIIAIRFVDFAALSGTYFLWMALIGTWASDTFAYFVGSRFGKNKLCPALSPGKTREGALGGLIGCIISVAAFAFFVNFDIVHSLFIGTLIGIVAPVGDLAESALKRFSGVKDSGKILPGHGGVLDRFDSIMFSAPVVYYYITNILT
ncbi:MAG: phosphatidate cytidylyltransferase [Veillonellaceae bacterium]|jgi:phosphatidate cytidylyltransferase|nr:phosphatidate cytidylyltransferase [Veillonellaceae bacterium]